ncbi:MAG: F0F1 ATP synthase subunit epsilon [Chlorobaculum sp.]|nr:F0F1 ATP synthase subunit epsilon [Chlorobaculum sp.]
MTESSMHLRILLPSTVFADLPEVEKLSVETVKGSYGFLPNRLDCVAPLAPGILSYRTGATESYVAIDHGVLVKTGREVVISVRHATGGVDLGSMENAVSREFVNLDERERSVRNTLARIESGFIRRYMELHRE